MSRVRAALFVDFDNIYSGLWEVDERAANVFATDPGLWLAWIERRLGGADDAASGFTRSVLIRNCYLNPSRFSRFRPDFTRAGFAVMDCPSLTLQGKSSADIRMVLDVVDTLEHQTHFDEFILFSGDADFTPLLQRLRAHDRRTAILAVGPASQAYRSAADLVIDEDEFVEEGLRMRIGEAPAPSPPDLRLVSQAPSPSAARAAPEASPELLDRLAHRVRREIQLTGRVIAGTLPRLFREFSEFRRDGNWLGYRSLRRLAEAVVARDPALALEGSEQQTWFVRFEEEPAAASPPPIADESRPAEPSADAVEEGPAEARPDLFAATSPVTAAFALRLSKVTGTPYLAPEDYRILFESIADSVRVVPFNISATPVHVRELCLARGCELSRQAIQFVVKGIGFGGHRLADDLAVHPPRALAVAFRDNVRKLCRNAQFVLSDEDAAQLDQ